MRSLRVLGVVVLALIAVPFIGRTGQAPLTLPVDRLPANTYAVLVWHGQNAIAKGAPTNNIVRLWNDPDFLSLRKTFSQELAGAAKADAAEGTSTLTPADHDAILDAIASPGIIGAAGPFDLSGFFESGPKAEPKSKESDLFIVWDAAGKDAQWKRIDDLVARNASDRTVTTVKLKGIDVRRSEWTSRVSFSGMVGKWHVEAGRQSNFEDLVTRLQAASAPASSLVQTPLYLEAQRFRAQNVLAEFLLKMPDLSTAKWPASDSFNVAAFLQGMHLERVRGFVGSIGLSGSGTQMRSALVGDTAPGSLFDLFGASTTTFSTLAAAPSGYSYNASKIDLGALYRTVRAALKGSMSPDQFANLEMMEGMAAAEMQMPLADLLSSIEEFASITPVDAVTTDFNKVMFAVRLKRPADFLGVIRKGLGSMISSDTVEGTTTYLTLAGPGSAMQVAVGPQLLVVAPTRELARAAIARAAAAGPQPGSLAADAAFQKGRALFPTALTSLAFSDMTKLPWHTLFGELGSTLAGKGKPGEPGQQIAVEMTQRLPALLARYLKSSSSAGWKAPGGVFFEGRID